MPPKQNLDYVQRLIRAEEERNRIIAEARQKKQHKVRQAKVDAEKAVGEFRKEKDGELKIYQDSLNVSASSEKATVHTDTEKQIAAMRKLSNQRLDRVADMLVGMVNAVVVDEK